MWTSELTPLSPDYKVDCESIAKIAWIKNMIGVQQNPEWHAEGDVFIHTMMVAKALVANPKWRMSDEEDRHALFVAALLHDVAKPQCTVMVDGKWSSPKHTVIGEQVARTILWQHDVPFNVREKIAKLVRYHGLPLQFLNKPDPVQSVIEASQEINLRQLAMIAEADVVGRICNDQQNLISTVDMFVDFCVEQNCLITPFQYQSQHHKFMHTVGKKPLDYVPYNNTWGEIVLMCGVPGSGKSTEAERRSINMKAPIICLDDIREKLDISPEDNQGAVVDAAEKEALALLRAEKTFVWDATNVFRDVRSSLVAMFAKYGASVRIVYVEAPTWKDMFSRNNERERKVPEHVILKMLTKLDMPSPNEAHEVEYVISK